MKRAAVGIELFCGCGGLSTGFLDAGLKVVAGFDIDRRSIEAYNYNHEYRGSKGYVVDVTKASGDELLELSGVSRIDFLIGGPPCQPFSIVGKRRGVEDDRAECIFHFLRLVRELRPRAVLFENVPNLSAFDDGRLLKRIVAGLRRLDYAVDSKIVAAADFGVPQVRRRLIIVALHRRKGVRHPSVTHAVSGRLPRYVSSQAALDDLPVAGYFGECKVFNHEPTDHTENMLKRLANLKPGQRETRSFHDRLHPDRPSYTLRAGTGNFSPLRPIHYKYNRVITVRESARLQGFQDDFIWPDWIPRLQQYRQVGNAVPPPVAQAYAKSIANQLGWILEPRKFRGNPLTRPSAITFTDAERKAMRQSRIRGASLGGACARRT